MWDGFEDGIFVGLFNPLLEDSVLPCTLGGTVKIFYSMAAAMVALPEQEEEKGFWDNALDFTKGLGTGLWKGAKGTVTGVADLVVWAGKHSTPYMLLNPQGYAEQLQKDKETFKAIGNMAVKAGTFVYRNSAVNALTDPSDYMAAQAESAEMAEQMMDKAANMSAEEWGDFTGQVLFEVLMEVGTAGGAADAVKLLDKVEDVGDGVKSLDKIEDIGDGVKALDKMEDGSSPLKAADELGDVVHLPKKKPAYRDLKHQEPCFLAGTIVHTPNGNIEIEKIKIGDEVFVYNFKDSKVNTRKVSKLYNNWTQRYFEINTDGENQILATSRHLFWVDNEKKWIPAKSITSGMNFRGLDNEIVPVKDVKETKNIELPTYNLEVEDIHNYFVGLNGILVHNQNDPSKFEKTTKTPIKIYEVYDIDSGETKYVGQTKHLDVDDRFDEHLKSKDTKKISRENWGKNYDIREVKSGNWTPYEAATWEQHYIEKNGGVAKLENGRNEITEKKYNKYGDEKYGHNPCP
ncbi:polymorphic toxin-type HINT domain-containing protein [Zobellia laminariae]|uniref:polymorphic toxin-type HINT domain-containing protein n=1 Tax=Zobellia laminariae TaxID=248906 RepID=UPI0026F4201F|nr:polymorphic toxin-type HINT domain-containing protein [Zobellia laminariae]WKX76190.1 polymorphic toxin-type HINT domain-containing protein [Zobellia laminariae]